MNKEYEGYLITLVEELKQKRIKQLEKLKPKNATPLRRESGLNFFLAHCLFVNKTKTEQVLIKVYSNNYIKKNWKQAMDVLSSYAKEKDDECIYNIETPISIVEYELLQSKLKTIQ